MCSPAIALVAVTVASAAASAYSQNQQAKYTSAVAEKNADIAESQAQDSINRGNAQADEIRRRNRQAAGTQTAMMGATAPNSPQVTRWISSVIRHSLARSMR